MFNFIRNLSTGVKVFMAVIVLAIILFIIGVAIPNVPLIVISVLAFIISVVAIVVMYYFQQPTGISDEKIVKDIAKKIKGSTSITIAELAKAFRITESQTRHYVFECVKADLIDGYTLAGDKVQLIDHTDPDTQVIKCTGCGATFASSQNIKECPYCGKLTK